MKTMKMLSPDDPGWARAWGEIARVYGDPACAHPEAGETWQYMGTAGGWHEFRHRALPAALLSRAVARMVFRPSAVRPGDCGGWRVYERVLVEAGDFRVLDHDAACGPGGDCEQAVR